MPIANVQRGDGVVITCPELVNLYGCTLGQGTRIGPFVEIQKGVTIGRNCKVSSHSFVCEGVTIEDEVFIGHGVMFTNDRYPRAANFDGSLQTDRLEARANSRQTTCFDRVKRDDCVWGNDWRRCSYCSGRGCHEERSR